ncbi:MAG: WD40 repeat domain-containing protein [Chloroflexi bacterium]|nr:WD40 repeat domain-containing protein [Chloroflexota bacterium]
MNDDFLRKHRKAPNRAFAEDLYRRLKAEEDDSAALPMTRIAARRGPFPIGAAAVLAILLVGLFHVLRPVSTPPQLTQIETGFFDSLQPIGVNNADDLVEIARLGNGAVYDVDWDGDVLALGGTRGVWIYDAGNLSDEPRLLESDEPTYGRQVTLASTDEIGVLAAAPDDGQIHVWDVDSGEEVGTFGEENRRFTTVAISPDGRIVAGGEGDFRRLKEPRQYAFVLWDRVMGEPIFRREFDWPISNIDFNPLRPDRFAVQTWEGVTVFGLEAEAALAQHLNTSISNQDSGLDYRSDGQALAFGADGGVMIWDLAADAVQEIPVDRGLKPFITDVSFSADASLLAIPSRNFGLNIWDVEAGAFRDGPPMATNGAQDVHAFAFNDALTDPMLASVRYGSELHFTLSTGDDASPVPLRDFASPIALSDLSPDNRTVATAGRSGPIHLWDLETGEERVIDSDRQFLTDLAFSPDGSVLAYTGFTEDGLDGNSLSNTRGGIALLDTETGAPIRQLDNSTRYFYQDGLQPGWGDAGRLRIE